MFLSITNLRFNFQKNHLPFKKKLSDSPTRIFLDEDGSSSLSSLSEIVTYTTLLMLKSSKPTISHPLFLYSKYLPFSIKSNFFVIKLLTDCGSLYPYCAWEWTKVSYTKVAVALTNFIGIISSVVPYSSVKFIVSSRQIILNN